MKQEEKLAAYFKALAAPARLRIFNLLKGRMLCVNALAEALKMTPAAISQHLRVMREAGLIQSEKRGYFVHYRLDPKALNEMGGLVQKLIKIEEKK
ncbi:MAG: ArsR/SmtB family transcription factor [Candidatus Saccharicenans sp.]|nr:MAG: transcriptional regulator [Candidatus Aminicenantes bacterium]HEK86403.1 ArsR family transcriptional regulator [Candidatus Aminicenantes bacterium]